MTDLTPNGDPSRERRPSPPPASAGPVTGTQVQEARRLLGWSSYRLAGFCSISAAVVRTYEKTGAVVEASPTIEAGALPFDRVAAIQAVLEAAGIEFTYEDASGVRLRRAERSS